MNEETFDKMIASQKDSEMRDAPTADEYDLKCVCCGINLEPDFQQTDTPLDHVGINDGFAGTISAGFGSTLDGCIILIGICDICVKSKVDNDRIYIVDNYIPGCGKYFKDGKLIFNNKEEDK